MATILPVEPGIFWRVNPKTGERSRSLTISYQANGKTRMESAKTTSVAAARTLRARRLVAGADGAPVPSGTLTVADALRRLETHYVQSGKPALATLRSHLGPLVAAIGARKAKGLTADDITALTTRWQAEPTGKQKDRPPVTNVTINRRLETLRAALRLAVKAGKLTTVPAIAMLGTDDAIMGKYLPAADRIVLAEHLPDPVATFLEFACQYGVRKGQLAKVERTWVNAPLQVITWPPKTTKRRRTHQIPLEGRGWAIVERLLTDGAERPWCPYLFHGAYCRPGRRPSKKYACIGNFKRAWATACRKAGLPVGRKAGGPLFHDSRNTAVTDLLAGGMGDREAMKISGHETLSMIDHYDMGNIEALRQRVAASRDALASLQPVIAFPLHSDARGAEGRRK
jgi:integrase